MAERLFTYGTLHQDSPPAELEDVVLKFIPAGEATVRGRLYQLQEYPGLVLDPAAEPVQGTIYEVPEEAWERLDTYEGYDPSVPESSLFLRVKADVQRPGGESESVWIYVYNRHTSE